MGPDEEYLIAKSLEEVRKGERVEDSATAWGTSATTVRRRRDGGLTMQEGLEPYQRLSKNNEDFVAEWICEEEDAGRAPNKAQLGRQLDSFRAKETKKEALQRYHDSLKRIFLKKNVQPGRITNMDECGVQEGESRDVGTKRDYRAFVRKAGKAVDNSAEVITALKLENQLLRDENESLKPVSKKKVKPSPGEAYANIEDIYRAQREAKQQQAKLVTNHKNQVALEKQDLLESASSALEHMRNPK
ncbi:hypothetical protein DL764_001333 [Monosporascus ibericus]|uniref:HTH CENPB-type domain-containing protein n=1 Tax=Monosporascus ibericus TaxID=155417 RepID=A0A4Q4TPQ9_9PEZI|nr:hypothetical protein DL764_001333 [Monosporascus ibericus]